MLFTAIFAQDAGLIYGQTTTFLYHLLALVIVASFTFFGSLLIYRLVALITRLRVSEEEEKIGLDLSQHSETVQVTTTPN